MVKYGGIIDDIIRIQEEKQELKGNIASLRTPDGIMISITDELEEFEVQADE